MSEQIQEKERAYQGAHHIWNLKARNPNVYLASDLVQEHVEMTKKSGRELVDLKATIFERGSKVKENGAFWDKKDPAQNDPLLLAEMISHFPTVVSNCISGNIGQDLPSLTLTEVSPTNITVVVPDQPAAVQEHLLAAGVVNYQVGNDTSGTWALMHNDLSGSNTGPLGIMKQILIR